MLCSLSQKIDANAMQAIQNLEKELGKPLLAFTCHNIAPAALSDDQLDKIQQLEKTLAISLVAVEQ